MANRVKSGLIPPERRYHLHFPPSGSLTGAGSGRGCDEDATRQERETHACSDEVRGEGYGRGGQRSLADVLDCQQDSAEPLVHAPMVGQTAPEVVPEDEAAARLAA